MILINVDTDTNIDNNLDKLINIINCDSYNIKNILNNLKKKLNQMIVILGQFYQNN